MTPPTNRDARERLQQRLSEIGGCSDGNCVVVKPTGMHTNGGCKCLRNFLTAQRVVNAYKVAVEALLFPDEVEGMGSSRDHALTDCSALGWRDMSDLPRDDTILVVVEGTEKNTIPASRSAKTYPMYVDPAGVLCCPGSWAPDPGIKAGMFRAIRWMPLPEPEATRSLTAVLSALYSAEINAGISSFWDGGWVIWIGDEMNGRRAEANFDARDGDPFKGAAGWLIETVRDQYPAFDLEAAFDQGLVIHSAPPRALLSGWWDIESNPVPSDGLIVAWDGNYAEVWDCHQYHVASGHVPMPSHWKVIKGMSEAITHWMPLPAPPSSAIQTAEAVPGTSNKPPRQGGE